jgi:hypothetical protein
MDSSVLSLPKSFKLFMNMYYSCVRTQLNLLQYIIRKRMCLLI